MAAISFAIGAVLIFEGLVFALVPSRIEDMLAAIRDLPLEARRLVGLIALVVGTVLLIASRAMGS